MPMPPSPITQDRLLIVEGKDAENFLGAMVRHCGRRDIQVQEYGGINDLSRYLRAIVVAPNWSRVATLGIIRDAETNAQSAMQSVRGAIAQAGMSIDGADPRISTFIFPDGRRPGMLETLLCDSFADSPINDCINEFLACSTERTGANVKRMEKARAHAYLATREDPHVSVGVAAQKDYWDLGHPAFEQLRDFIAGL